MLLKYPNYILYEHRLKSFDTSPYTKQWSAKLANAGFFYQNNSIKCFYCGGIIKDLIPELYNISELHLVWDPKCEYALRYKDCETINLIRKESSAEQLNKF